ncbi:MAG TPA: hypothetical protein VL371_08630 [Gemmataceae bacterium]|jgi:hypothetical protein|nr:hypothetical protein [Gemmataceae bacterium]
MRKSLTLAGLVLALLVPSVVQANGLIAAGQREVDQYGFRKRHFPRAAPWFLYWPYEAYFTYPAPTGVAFPPSHMTPPAGFQPHMYNNGGGQFAPYPTNGFGQ